MKEKPEYEKFSMVKQYRGVGVRRRTFSHIFVAIYEIEVGT